MTTTTRRMTAYDYDLIALALSHTLRDYRKNDWEHFITYEKMEELLEQTMEKAGLDYDQKENYRR